MRLSSYIQRTRALGDHQIPPAVIDQLAERIDEGADLAALLKKRSAVLTPRLLLGIWRAWRRHHDHMAYLDEVAERRRQAGQSPIVPALLKQTTAAHEVAVLERAEEMAPPGRVPEHRRRDAIKEAVALWNQCLAATRREGVLAVRGDEDEAPGEYSDLVGEAPLAERSAADWRRIRRGEAVDALSVSLSVPVERIKALISARGAEIQALTTGRTLIEFLHDLILVDVDEWALALKDEEAGLVGIREASSTWFEMLSTARPAQALYAGVLVADPGDPVGVAVLTRDGRLLEVGEVAGDAPTVPGVEAILGRHPVEAVVFPDQVGDPERLEALKAAFSSLAALEGSVEALDAAVEASPEEGPPAGLRALGMARRVVRPLKYWGAQDPLSVRLHNDQADLPTEDLLGALNDMRALALAGVKPSDLQKAPPSPKPAAPRLPAKPLNPMIKSVDDLRPGLTLNGVVTNITQFGAFLNIGLSHEGLVHVSELADHFVNDPKEVVTVGQQVEARVLGVDRARRRISLSLRSDRAPAAPPRREGGEPARQRLDDIPGTRGGNQRRTGPGGDRPRPPATGASRAQALADLEALFKKK
ncbi:MAG: S1 RNA-binding domain-containing protein [Myxococcales bacterium]|nr:S1 RNA-binding domain-containing protein [Myxococcales bacterium]